MADNHAEDDDEDGFGDFKFASNPTKKSTSNPINGADFFSTTTTTIKNNNEDDDDWGDFINSSTVLSHTESLPNSSSLTSKPSDPLGFFADRTHNDSAELTQPGSAPSRVESSQKVRTQWVGLQGALPLSIFGEEEEEGSGAVDPSFNGATNLFSTKNNNKNESAKKGSSLNVGIGFNDLIGNMYTGKAENGTKTDSNDGLGLGSNVSNSGKNGESLDLNGQNWDWYGLNLNRNVLNLGSNGADLKGTGMNLDTSGLDTNRNASNMGTYGSNLNWNPLNLDASRSVWNRDVSIPVTNGGTLDSNGVGLVNQNEEFDEGDGWEFKAADAKLPAGDEHSKNGEKKTENGPTSSSNESNLSWNVLSLDLSGMNLNVNGVNSDTSLLKSDLADESKDFGNDDGWEFKGAESETQKVDGSTKVEGKGLKISEGAEYTFGFGNGAKDPGVIFAASDRTSQKSGGWNFVFDFNSSSATQNSTISPSYSQSQKNETINGLNSSPVEGSFDSDENPWTFKDAFPETGLKDKEEPKVADISPTGVEAFAFDGEMQRSELRLEKHQGPLPLSIFGDGDLEKDDPLVHQDISSSMHASFGDHVKRPGSVVSINDLISSLYSQPDENILVNQTEKSSENGFVSTETVMDSNLESGNDDFDDDSWEFKGAFSGSGAESQTFIPGVGDLNEKYVIKEELNDYVDLYSKLKDELCYIALCHRDNLKKARSIAADSDEDAEVKALDREIQDLHNQLHQDTMIPGEVHPENLPPRNICVDQFVQVLREPKFQAFESEYHLSKRLLLAEKDLRLTIELLKHAALTLKILTLQSMEEQSNYVSKWTNIVSVCAQELRHGAWIWKQALLKNVQNKILSKPQGKKYLLALGEIYRVVEIIGSSTKLYKPWILLSSADNPSLSALLSECSTIWSSSGLEEALQSMSDSTGFESDGTVNGLLESINYVGDHDALSLYNNVFSGKEPTCRLSVLTSGTVPGMKMVVWNGEHYFLTLANLWANLISSDPPDLPHINVG